MRFLPSCGPLKGRSGDPTGHARVLPRFLAGTLSLLTALCTTVPAVFPAEDDPVTDLGEMVVSSDKQDFADPALEDLSAFVTVIDMAEFEDRFVTFPELLQKSVGVNVRSFGGLGAFTTVSLRGSSGDQVTILLDGVPLNRAKSGYVNLSNIPLKTVERIEVYRGVAPLRFRASSIGGVINLVTRKVEEEEAYQVSFSHGSYGTWDVSATGSGRQGNLGCLVSGNYWKTNGDFEAYDNNDTLLVDYDDQMTERVNNDFDAHDLLTKFTYSLRPDLELVVTNEFFNKAEGVPGNITHQSTVAHLNTLRNVSYARIGKQGLGVPGLDGELAVHALLEKSEFMDPHGEVGVGNQDNRDRSVTLGADTCLTYLWGTRQLLSLVLSCQWEHFDSEDSLVQESIRKGDPQDRLTYQVGLEDEIYLWNERLVLTPQVLFTQLDHNFGGRLPFYPKGTFGSPPDRGYLNAKAGFLARVTDLVSVKGNVARYHRFPNLTELFGDKGWIRGNPELEAEEGLNWDIGMTFNASEPRLFGPVMLGQALLELNYFSSDTDNLIVLSQVSQLLLEADNSSSAEIRGLELAWTFDLFDHLTITGNLTLQETEEVGNEPHYRGKELPGRPPQEYFNRTAFYTSRFTLFHEWTRISANYGNRYNHPYYPFFIASRDIHNLGLTWNPNDRVSLNFEVKNIADKRVYDYYQFPMPGRTYYGTVRMTF